MSEKGSFAGGFIAGAIVGSIVGGVIGSLLASGTKAKVFEEEEDEILLESKEEFDDNSSKLNEGVGRNLEDQINQINLAIDDLRQHLKTGNNHANS